jgi:hypothetical protein
MYINTANQQFASHHLTKESHSEILQFLKNKEIFDTMEVICQVVGLVLLTLYFLQKSTRFNFVQEVVLPCALEFSTALRKIGVLGPEEQMQFVKKHKLPVFIAKIPILGDESQNVKAKLYPFSRGILASPAIYSQNIGKRMLCLNAEDYQHIIEEQSQKASLSDNTQLAVKKQEVTALTSTLKAEMEKTAALQQEVNELKVQMKTLGARIGRAGVTVKEALLFAHIALPLIEHLKQEATGRKYTRPDIQAAFLEEVERQADMKGTLQEIFDSKELILPEAYMKAIRNELPGLVSTGGRSPLKNTSVSQ